MYTDMEMWRDIRRRVIADGESKRLICREYGIHFRTLQKIVANTTPPGYRQTKPREKRKVGPYLPFIEDILAEDKKAPSEQRHTAKRIYKHLISEQCYDGGYTAVKEAVRAIKHRNREAFVPLSHPPGWAQVGGLRACHDRVGWRADGSGVFCHDAALFRCVPCLCLPG